jgi:protein neuralized
VAFGLTSCDPTTIDVQNLPEDSDLLLDRSEYWVVSKDVANCPASGDELSFQINRDGSVEFAKNGNSPSVFMHVDTSLPLWPFWDIYGHTSKIRLVGSTSDPVPRVGPSPASQLPNPGLPPATSVDSGSQLPPQYQPQALSECTVCFEKCKLDSFIIHIHTNWLP